MRKALRKGNEMQQHILRVLRANCDCGEYPVPPEQNGKCFKCCAADEIERLQKIAETARDVYPQADPDNWSVQELKRMLSS